jgi:hypothetical protein
MGRDILVGHTPPHYLFMSVSRSIIALLALLLALGLVLMVSRKKAEAPVIDETLATTTLALPREPDAEGISVADTYGNGVHLYSFDLYLPTPCHHLSDPDVIVRESYPEQIAISYTVLPPDPDVLCAQVITRTPVTAKATASEGAVLTSIVLGSTPIAFVLNRTN